MKRIISMFLALALALSFSVAFAANPKPLTQAEKDQIGKIAADYIIAHPQILEQAAMALQKQRQEQVTKQAVSAFSKNFQSLTSGNNALTLSNAPADTKAPITIVEFMDYQCIHCQQVEPAIDVLLKSADIRIVVHPWPIFGEASILAVHAAYAAQEQGKFKAMHEALINLKGNPGQPLTLAEIKKAASDAGLNMGEFNKAMDDKAIDKTIQETNAFAQLLGLQGTPAFFITPTAKPKTDKDIFLVAGADISSVAEKVNEVRKELHSQKGTEKDYSSKS